MSRTKKRDALVDAAIAARKNAYAPYSKFQVGAAIEHADGRVFTGVNVENCSFGLTVCAERNAVASGVVGGMKPGQLARVAIAADGPTLVPPCGACRQVLAEFAARGAKALLFNARDESIEEISLADLLPHAFEQASLPRA
jgi:cytidine deaminase